MKSPVLRAIASHFSYLRRTVIAEVAARLSPRGVTPAEHNVLFLLSHDGAMPQHELAQDGLDPGAISRLVARLAERGLVTVAVDPSDRRRRLVRITPAGRRLERSLVPLVDAAVRHAVTGLTEREERQLLRLLEKAVSATRAEHEKRRSGRTK